MDGGDWWAAVHGAAKSRARLSDFTFAFHFHALEKEMATHSSVLALRVPGTGEPGGLLSMGSHWVGHAWSDLAAAEANMVNWFLTKKQKQYNWEKITSSTVLEQLDIHIAKKWTRHRPYSLYKHQLKMDHRPKWKTQMWTTQKSVILVFVEFFLI